MHVAELKKTITYHTRFYTRFYWQRQYPTDTKKLRTELTARMIRNKIEQITTCLQAGQTQQLVVCLRQNHVSEKAKWQWQRKVVANGATTPSHMNFAR